MQDAHWKNDEHLFFGTLRDASIKRSAAQTLQFDKITSKRVDAHQGTALVAADFVASAEWGTSPVLTVVGGTDQAASITIQAKVTTSASPKITLTFHDGTWTNVPVVVAQRTDVVAATAAPGATVTNQWVVTAITATSVEFTFNGQPVANNTYGLAFEVFGT